MLACQRAICAVSSWKRTPAFVSSPQKGARPVLEFTSRQGVGWGRWRGSIWGDTCSLLIQRGLSKMGCVHPWRCRSERQGWAQSPGVSEGFWLNIWYVPGILRALDWGILVEGSTEHGSWGQMDTAWYKWIPGPSFYCLLSVWRLFADPHSAEYGLLLVWRKYFGNFWNLEFLEFRQILNL